MSNVNMLDPVAYMEIMKSGTGHKTGLYFDKVRGFPVGDYELYTEDQIEAYANARVKEALKEAAAICWDMKSWTECGKDGKDYWLSIAERRIRDLIPKED